MRYFPGSTPLATISAEIREVLQDVVLGANAANVDWQSLAAGYERYELFALARSTVAGDADGMDIKFNNDATAANYYRSYQTGGTSAANGSDDGFDAAVITGATSIAEEFGSVQAIIYSPHGALHKTVSTLSTVRRAAANFQTSIRGMVWENVAAITRITLNPSSASNFLAGSRFRLVGIKTVNVAVVV